MKAWSAIFFCFLHLIGIFNRAYADGYYDSCECPLPFVQPWVRGEYLGWTLKSSPLSCPLVTSASFSDSIPGALGQHHTKVLLGDQNEGMGWQNGFKLGIGAIINSCIPIEIEASYFILPKTTTTRTFFTSGEPGSRNFAVPIFDVTGFWGLKGKPGETVYILPGPLDGGPGFAGNFHFRLWNILQGSEVNAYLYVKKWSHFSVEGIAGFRWLQFQESLTFSANTNTVIDFPFDAGFYTFKDHFKTTNTFYGGQIGFRTRYEQCCWLLALTAKAGFGWLNQHVNIHGHADTLGGNLFYATKGAAHHLEGGVFAQPTNIGHHKKNKFGAIFETNLCIGYQLTSWVEISLGYTFLLINEVVRPGDQIDRKINPTLTGLAHASRKSVGTSKGPIPFGESRGAEKPQGPKRPDRHFKTQLFWAQGLTAELKFRF